MSLDAITLTKVRQQSIRNLIYKNCKEKEGREMEKKQKTNRKRASSEDGRPK